MQGHERVSMGGKYFFKFTGLILPLAALSSEQRPETFWVAVTHFDEHHPGGGASCCFI
jgi:hypothetical protein